MKIFKLLITGAILTTMMSSCLKDKFDIINPAGSSSVVEFKNPVAPSPESPEGSLFTVFPISYEVAPTVEASYTIQLTGPDPAPQDVVVNIGVREATVTEFNKSKTDLVSTFPVYTILPSTLYTITTPTVTIPAGQRTAVVKVTYKTAQFNFDAKYGLPLTITSTNYAGVSKNFGSIILNVAAKNKYDGVYTVVPTAPFQDLAAPANVGRATMKAELRTVNATSVAMYDGYYYINGYGHAFASGYYGNWSPVFNMDAADNVTSVTNYYGQGTNSSLRSAKISTGVNKWTTITGSSKVMEVSYIMTQGGVDRLIYAEKWTYTGSR